MENGTPYGWSILCRNRTLCFASGCLLFWAGATNAVASYSLLSMRVTHLTGPVTDQAKFLLSDLVSALWITIIILSFVGGAYWAAKAQSLLTFTQALLVPATPLLLAGGLMYAGYAEISTALFGILLPFATGWQNSITSHGPIGRTTHLTGDLTDLGIALAGGDLSRARHLLMKYIGFVAGAAAGYLGSRHIPALSLIMVGAGYAVTILFFHTKNARELKRATAMQLPRRSMLTNYETEAL